MTQLTVAMFLSKTAANFCICQKWLSDLFDKFLILNPFTILWFAPYNFFFVFFRNRAETGITVEHRFRKKIQVFGFGKGSVEGLENTLSSTQIANTMGCFLPYQVGCFVSGILLGPRMADECTLVTADSPPKFISI